MTRATDKSFSMCLYSSYSLLLSYTLFKSLVFPLLIIDYSTSELLYSGGFAAGFSAPTMATIQKEFDLEDNTISWFGKLICIFTNLHK